MVAAAPAALPAAAIAARAALALRLSRLLLILSDHRAGGAGVGRSAAQQRERQGGRDQTFHFMLQGP